MYKVLSNIRHPETREILAHRGDHISYEQFAELQREYGVSWDAVDGPD